MGIMKERMLAGELYIADDPDLASDNQRAMALMEQFNASPAAEGEARRRILTNLFGGFGEGSEVRPPLYCDYGNFITIGKGTFINFGARLLDVAPITIGNNVSLGGGAIVLPGVSIGGNTIVGAGAVVTKSLPVNVVAVVNPARIVREL
jgi:maltose O-acetyltransferase